VRREREREREVILNQKVIAVYSVLKILCKFALKSGRQGNGKKANNQCDFLWLEK
jgi:hypothetical protein